MPDTTTGGFAGSPLEALTPPAQAGGCCGTAVAIDVPTASTGGCCGTAATPAASEPTAVSAEGCCG